MNSSATVLVIDGGGRGSALVDKYQQSSQVGKVLAIPGNDLMGIYSKKPLKIFPKIKTTDIKQIITIAKRENVDLTDVAQDDAVAAGLVDELTSAGFKVFGPTRDSGQIEWDKAFSRNFMKRFNIPAPAFNICTSEKEGIKFVKSQKEREWYIKASGLAAGKGALHAKNNQEAIANISQMKIFGASGKTFLIEECLEGEEFSSFAVVDGNDFIVIGHAQDHKRVFASDKGPNTGGMGCSSPPLVISKIIEDQIKSIFRKTVQGLVKLKRSYQGILYLGGMIDKRGKVYVIEFNARWGDPEAQVIIPSIKNDLYEIVNKVIGGSIKNIKIKKDNLYRITVTAAARGYPQDYSNVLGKQIFGLSKILKNKSLKIYSAGVKKSKKKYLVAGGRMFYITAAGKDVADARQKAYNALSLTYVEGNNLHYRTDIGFRDLARSYQ